MAKRELMSGITGLDGSYLTELLLLKRVRMITIHLRIGLVRKGGGDAFLA